MIKNFLAAILSILIVGNAVAQENRVNVIIDINTNIETNGAGQISGAKLNSVLQNMTNSAIFGPAPASVVVGDYACWTDTFGNLVSDCKGVTGPNTSIVNDYACWNNITGSLLTDCKGVTGPNTTVVNDYACWNNTLGSLLKDCPVILNIGSTTITGAAPSILTNISGILQDIPLLNSLPGSSGVIYSSGSGFGTLTLNNGITYSAGTLNLLNITQVTTNKFWTETGAHIDRFNDRVFIADGTKNDGSNTSCPNGDWWSNATHSLGQGCAANISTVLIEVNPYSDLGTYNGNAAQFGLSLAIETGQMVHSGTPVAFGMFAYRNGSVATSLWGRYTEIWDLSTITTNNIYGEELQLTTTNPNTAKNWTPYSNTGTALIGLLIGAGADTCPSGCGNTGGGTHYHPTAGILFAPNPDPLAAGILFDNNSIATDGPGGRIMMIGAPHDYEIDWFTSGSTVGASISMDSSGNIIFTSAGHLYVGTVASGHRGLCSTSAVDLTPIAC